MEFNKNKSYFVSTAEFKEINKYPFVAGMLSIILGMFGVHRFYLKRKLSGFIFLVISILSLQFGKGYAATILIFISLIEDIVYIIKGIALLKSKFINNNINKEKYIEKFENSNTGEKNKVNIKENSIETNNTQEIKDIKIIEVSDIKTSKISNKDVTYNTLKNNWVKKLELPYERNVIEVEQVRDETINFYEKLCDFIDEELKNNRSSLNKEVKRIERKGGYYGNILYTIYCISEGHVTKKYSGDYNYYNYEYSYNILEEHLGKNLKNKVFIKAQELESRILPPNEDTLEYFNLTENGLKREWWDKNGKLRAKREFNEKELNILMATPARSTIVWDINEVNKHIIFLYLEIWEIIASGLEKDLKWEKRKRKILKNLIDGKYEYFLDYENGNILASLLKISENTIRRVMPNTQILKTSNEINNVKNYLPKGILLDIKNKLIEYKTSFDDEELNKILLEMIKNSPSDWKLKVKQIITAEDDKKISILIVYREDGNFIKIAKQVIKETDNEDLLLICLYGIEREEKLSQKNKKLLESIIYTSNINVYENILSSKQVLSLELFNKLKEIKNPIRKKIELDMDKVEQSKQELNQTVKIVKKYIGDEEENKEIKDDKVKVKDNKVKYRDFLKLILSSGVVSIDEGKKIAMNNGTLLNAFISDINRELYDDIQDQVIMIEDDYIKIDDFYVDMIKELVMNEK